MTRNLTPILLGANAPRVLTVPMCMAALADSRGLPDKKTVTRWIQAQRTAGVLRPMTRGLYLNNLARPRPQAAEAAAYIRTGAVVSLQTVLGDAGVSNNYSDIVTSVLPIRGRATSFSRTVRAPGLEFRFHAMPERLLDERAGSLKTSFLTSMCPMPGLLPRKHSWIGSIWGPQFEQNLFSCPRYGFLEAQCSSAEALSEVDELTGIAEGIPRKEVPVRP